MNHRIQKFLFVILLTLLPAAVYGMDNNVYIKHSSGLFLGNNSGRAVIFSSSDERTVPVLMEETADGWLNISVPAADGSRLYLYKTGSWNTSFGTSRDINEAKFRIDGDTEGYVRIYCKANNRCLGTDNVTAGSNVYSDKDGSDIKHQWFITADPDAVPDVTAIGYTIDADNLRQTTEGWGVSLCWWANMCGKWSDEKIDLIVDWLVSPDGLNYNIFRYNIGGGDDPDNAHCTAHHMGKGKGLRAEMEGFKDSSDDTYHWDRDAAQRKIMLKIKEKRPDAIFEAFSNTPPWYMTYSGCCAGHTDGAKDNLRPEYYEEFARYLVDVCLHYRDEYGIEFRTLEPFNESNTNYWYCGGGQEGCHFDYSSQIAFIKVLYPILQESGLATVISAADETGVWPAICGLNEYSKAGILDMVGQWNTHTYSGNNGDRSNFNELVRATGSRLWMSETGAGGNGLQGNLSMAQRLIDDIRYIEPDAWLDWQYIEENNDQWCLVKATFASQSASRIKNYYVRQHFSSHIKPGYTLVGTNNEQTLVALSPEADTLVVTALNAQSTEKAYVGRIKNFKSSGTVQSYITTTSKNHAAEEIATIDEAGNLYYTMPASSICTMILTKSENEGIINPVADLAKWRMVGNTLSVETLSPCRISVYTPSGMLIYTGTDGKNIPLARGIYLLVVTDDVQSYTAKISVTL